MKSFFEHLYVLSIEDFVYSITSFFGVVSIGILCFVFLARILLKRRENTL